MTSRHKAGVRSNNRGRDWFRSPRMFTISGRRSTALRAVANSLTMRLLRETGVTGAASIFDLVIAGAGPSGLALAAAVKEAMRSGVSIALVDPASQPGSGAARLRTVAIADGPRRLLERIGAWQAIEPKAQPILKMAIMDGQARDAVRPTHLNFEAKGGDPLAHMAFNDDVIGALAALCDRLEVQRFAASVAYWSPGKRVAALGLSDGRSMRARLAVAADGARSKLGALAGVAT